jgi:hypothetical protein
MGDGMSGDTLPFCGIIYRCLMEKPMNLRREVDRAKPRSALRKPEICNGHLSHHFGEPGSRPDFLSFPFVLRDLCGEMLFSA